MRGEVGGDGVEVGGPVQPDDEEAVVRRRTPQRSPVAVAAGQPDGHPRRRQEPDVARGVVLALVVDGLAAQQAGQDREALVEHPAAHPGVRLVAERAELPHPVVAEPEAQHEAATGQDGQAGGLAGQHLRPAARQRGDHRPEQQPLGAQGDRRAARPRVGDRGHPVAVQQVVPDEEAVPAGRLGLGGEVADDPGVGEGVEGGDEEAAVRGHDAIRACGRCGVRQSA